MSGLTIILEVFTSKRTKLLKFNVPANADIEIRRRSERRKDEIRVDGE